MNPGVTCKSDAALQRKEIDMWFLIARPPAADVPYWPGRRFLAVLDAVAWPLLWVLVVAHAPPSVGVAGPVVATLAVLSAVRRLRRAVWCNHRYRFTTWRWGGAAAWLVLAGLILRLAVTSMTGR